MTVSRHRRRTPTRSNFRPSRRAALPSAVTAGTVGLSAFTGTWLPWTITGLLALLGVCIAALVTAAFSDRSEPWERLSDALRLTLGREFRRNKQASVQAPTVIEATATELKELPAVKPKTASPPDRGDSMPNSRIRRGKGSA
ncbi:hypothetical protein [Umezawaea sp. Da 62-37]|uniref:hypothetical protein n=1 Tax=Umezawaea sp. Da 62-37 TaxID=3075927 RepID=UPI0028F74BB5|nr:hypothetical protein [Umezawaea sp. Da 62-37]WNV84952.1 hypothetical protein RM788_43490 [Umezawaea sp. Da 62-37]